MTYTPYHDPWRNLRGGGTSVVAAALDHIEAGIVIPNASLTLTIPLQIAASAGDTEITVAAELPQFGLEDSWSMILINPWTTQAELRRVEGISGTTLSFEGGEGLDEDHPKGTQVIVVQKEVVVDWFGAQRGFTADPAANVTAFNRCFEQLSHTVNGYPMTVQMLTGIYRIDAPVTIPATPVGLILQANGDAGLVCTQDFGADTYALDNLDHTAPAGVTLRGFSVTSSNNVLTVGTPPVAMKGIRLRGRTKAQDLYASGFYAGFAIDGSDDHVTMQQCWAANNFFSYYLGNAGGSSTAGDLSFTKCDSDGAGRAHWGIGTGQHLVGSSFRDCSWFGAPFTFFCESGSTAWSNVAFINCNSEFSGNCMFYAAAGSQASLDELNFIGGGHSIQTGTAYEDPAFATGAFFYNASGAPLSATRWQGMPQTSGYFDIFGGSNGWRVYKNAFMLAEITNLVTQGKKVLNTPWDNGTYDSTTTQNRLLITDGLGSECGVATLQTVTTGVTRGDLLETVSGTSGSKARVYQTSGAAPYGVAQYADQGGSFPNTLVLQSGEARINVKSTNSVTLGNWLKPDLVNPGMVVAAASFSDGPIVGFALYGHQDNSTAQWGMSSTRSVFAKLF